MTIGHIGILDRGCIYCGYGGHSLKDGHFGWVNINGEQFYNCPNCHRLTPYDEEKK